MKLTTPFLAVLGLAGPALTAGAQDCASPGSDILAWYDGDAVSGNTLQDIVGGNDVSAPTVVPAVGLVGDSFVLDGSGSTALSLGAPLLDSTGPWGIEAWIRVDPSTAGQTVTIVSENGAEGGSRAGQFALRHLTNNTIQILRLTGSGVLCKTLTSSAIAPLGIWNHVAASFGGANDNDLHLWINGTKQTTSVVSSNFNIASPNELRVGMTQPGDSYYMGDIDELTIYGRGLTSDEIAAAVSAPSSGRCKTCTSSAAQDADFYWTADRECSGFQLDNTGGFAMQAMNSAATDPGIDGRSFQVAGGTQHFTAGMPLMDTTGDISVSAWVYPKTNTFHNIVSEFGLDPGNVEGQFVLRALNSGNSYRLQFLRTDGRVGSCGGGANAYCVDSIGSVEPIPLLRWTHVAATYDAGTDTYKLYVNGVESLLPRSSSYVIASIPRETRIGRTESLYGNSRIDEVALHRRVLTAQEIEDAYRAGRWGKCETPDNEMRCIPGSQNGFSIQTQVNASGTPDAMQKFLRAGDLLEVRMYSPDGSTVGFPPILGASVFAQGVGPGPHPTWPEFFLDPASTLTLYNGVTGGPLGFTVLPPGGTTLAYNIPPGLEGMVIRLQGASFQSPLNFSQAHDIEVRF